MAARGARRAIVCHARRKTAFRLHCARHPAGQRGVWDPVRVYSRARRARLTSLDNIGATS